MKKYILITLSLAFAAQINAQNNLVFNQVILLELTSSGTTVPEGKIWKVEDGQGGYVYSVNEEPWLVGASGSYKSTPTWFPEGSVFTKFSGNNSINTLSILEFNVVPISSTGSGTVDTGISNGALPGDDYTPGDSFSDPDGNTYDTVEINGQTWTTTNLNVSTYRDGTPIPYISDFDEWTSTTTGAYTYAGQDSGAGYGKLYNVYALAGLHDNDGATPNKILAPEGYHIPSPLEWKALIDIYMAGSGAAFICGQGNSNGFQANVASTFLKSQTSWNNNGTNESGLNIKNYPVIYQGHSGSTEQNSNFSNVIYFGSTHFATNQIINYTNTDLRYTGIVIGEFSLNDYTLFGLGGTNTNSDSGFYIRLVKD